MFDEEYGRAPTTQRVVTYWDTCTPGLALRVSPAGNRIFYAVRRPAGGGNPVWRKLGDWPGLSLREARDACRTIPLTPLTKKLLSELPP
jgi:hypothetical protein